MRARFSQSSRPEVDRWNYMASRDSGALYVEYPVRVSKSPNNITMSTANASNFIPFGQRQTSRSSASESMAVVMGASRGTSRKREAYGIILVGYAVVANRLAVMHATTRVFTGAAFSTLRGRRR